MERHVSDHAACGRTSGYLYAKRAGRRSYLADYQEDFFWPLEALQDRGCRGLPVASGIREEYDIREEYGIWQSLCRGATAHAINMGVDKDLVYLINKWRKETQGHSRSGPIIDVCADLDALIPTTIKCSLSL